MNDDTAMRIEAWFDGELDAAGRAEVEALLQRDPQARTHLDRLRRLRAALQQAQAGPGRASAAWAAVAARIEPAAAATGRPWRGPVLAGLRLFGAAAAVLLLGMAVWWPLRHSGGDGSPPLSTLVEMVETDLEGATSIVYIDRPSGWTVVWVVEADDPGRG